MGNLSGFTSLGCPVQYKEIRYCVSVANFLFILLLVYIVGS